MFGLFGHRLPERFEGTYRCFPVSFLERNDLEYGDKVVLPPSALHTLGEARDWGRLIAAVRPVRTL
jgi:ubiquitin fusion degradation protein 1